MKLRFIFLLGIIFTLASTTLSQDTSQTPARIAIRVVDGTGEFYDTQSGETFVPRGVNYIGWQVTNAGIRNRVLDTALYDAEAVRADFQHIAEGGYNTVRLFIDSCNQGATCIGNVNGTGLNPEYIANLADVIQIAADTGIYLVLTSNDLPDDGGYWEISNRGASAQFEGYRNAHYLTAAGVESAETYWRDLMTALMALNPPTEALLGWSILNEQWYFKLQPPLSLSSGIVTTANGESYDMSDPDEKTAMLVDAIVHYIAATSAVIREFDPDTLITMGFFAPQFPNETTIGGDWYVNTAPLMGRADLDFFDFHAYPGIDLTIQQNAENFGMGARPEIPVLMGEVGAFRHLYASVDLAAVALQEWIAGSCDVGFDGWLIWDYFGAPERVGDATWGALAEDGTIFEAIAPQNQPDPCQISDIQLANIAFRQPVTASRALPDEPASNINDGSANQWGSGADAPQWIEISLNGAVPVNRVTLRVAQYPEGETLHQVWAIVADGSRVLLREFDQMTRDDDLLEIDLSAPLGDVTAIRVETLASPSWVAWKEIEVFSGGNGSACVVFASTPANLRAEPSTNSEIGGSLRAGTGAIVDGQRTADDGFRWYHLPQDVWVREDVITLSGDCESLSDTE